LSSRAFIASFHGPIDMPSPITSSVTPWRMSLWPRPSAISDSVAQLSMLMKPGATASPLASTSVPPTPARRGATSTIRSALMPTSPV
jgi:hypothetical protein